MYYQRNACIGLTNIIYDSSTIILEQAISFQSNGPLYTKRWIIKFDSFKYKKLFDSVKHISLILESSNILKIKNNSTTFTLVRLSMQKYYESYMDILREVKKILKRDSNRKRKLKYVLKNHQSVLLIPNIKLRSCSEDKQYFLKNKLNDASQRLFKTVNLQNLRANATKNTQDCLDQKYVSAFFRENTTDFIQSDLKSSCNEIVAAIGNVIIEKSTRTRTSLTSLSVAVERKHLNTISKSPSNELPLIIDKDIPKNIETSLEKCTAGSNSTINANKSSLRSSFSFQNSFLDKITKFEIVSKDIFKHQSQVESIQTQSSTLLKLPSTSETSSSQSSIKQNISTSPKNKQNSQIEKESMKCADQIVTTMSSESDLPTCITPVMDNSTSNISYSKVSRSISRSLSQSSRKIPTRSRSKESTCTLTSTTRCDRRSYSYSSRSSNSSQMSRYLFSGSSRSRSPSIPRRYGSPSFLDRRRITSARKRPIPYHRPSPSSSSMSSLSLSSRSSLGSSHCDDWSPQSSKTNRSYDS